jgi:hypothetical protein
VLQRTRVLINRGQRQVVLFARRLPLPAAVMTLARSTW